jgi:hypothetical protein
MKFFELAKNFPENWNFTMIKHTSWFYEAQSLLKRSIIMNVILIIIRIGIIMYFIFVINNLYNAAIEYK